MRSRHLYAGLLAVVLSLGTVACGADSTGELDKGDLSKQLVDAGMPKEQADCMADAMIDADFTEEEVDKLNAGDTDAVDDAKYKAFMDATVKCVTG